MSVNPDDETRGRVTALDRDVSRALKTMVKDSKIPVAQMANTIGKPANTLHAYLDGKLATPLYVLVQCAKAMNVGVDAILREAKILPEVPSVEESIDRDKRLPPANRATAKSVYRSLLSDANS